MTDATDDVKVYVLIPTNIYDHGCVGVFETREAAERVATELWPQTDGHHSFRVEEKTIGRAYPDAFQRCMYDPDDPAVAEFHRPAQGPPQIVFVVDETPERPSPGS